jgi:hypothetical protein
MGSFEVCTVINLGTLFPCSTVYTSIVDVKNVLQLFFYIPYIYRLRYTAKNLIYIYKKKNREKCQFEGSPPARLFLMSLLNRGPLGDTYTAKT